MYCTRVICPLLPSSHQAEHLQHVVNLNIVLPAGEQADAPPAYEGSTQEGAARALSSVDCAYNSIASCSQRDHKKIFSAPEHIYSKLHELVVVRLMRRGLLQFLQPCLLLQC
eukprot:3248127-Amphidinium_carterae.1